MHTHLATHALPHRSVSVHRYTHLVIHALQDNPWTNTTQSDTHAHTHQAIHALQDNPMHTFTHTQTLTHAHTRGYACTATRPCLHTHTHLAIHALQDNPIDTNNTLRHSPTHTGYPCTTPCTHTNTLTHLQHTHNWLSNCSTTHPQLLKHELQHHITPIPSAPTPNPNHTTTTRLIGHP
jgi:hypothetical protein